jgi:hypothetical protein
MQTSHICVDNPVESEHSYGQQFLIGFLFSVSSVGMILVNKAAVSVLSHAGFLLLLQNLVTILLVWSLYPEVAASLKKSWRWFPCAILFSLNIFSSLQCLYFVSVATFTVLRNTQPIIAAGIDHSFRREITRPERIFFLFVVLVGALVYGWSDLNFHLQGYMWAITHVLSMSLYSVLVKVLGTDMALSARDMSFLNNALSLPILLAVTMLSAAFESSNNTIVEVSIMCSGSARCVCVVLASCFGGFACHSTVFVRSK